MIRCIAAIDEKLGLATNHGIPWDVPSDRRYFRDKTASDWLLMGFHTYASLPMTLPGRHNWVVTNQAEPLRVGFEPVANAAEFLENNKAQNIWIIGGAALFAQTITRAEQLYLTLIVGDFNCTKFFPYYERDFHLIQAEPWQKQNGVRFRFCRYGKN